MIIVLILAMLLGQMLTDETLKCYLGNIKLLNRKPFTCRMCLSTHLTWIGEGILALAFGSWPMFWIGLIAAAGVFLSILTEQEEKTLTTDEWSEYKKEIEQ